MSIEMKMNNSPSRWIRLRRWCCWCGAFRCRPRCSSGRRGRPRRSGRPRSRPRRPSRVLVRRPRSQESQLSHRKQISAQSRWGTCRREESPNGILKKAIKAVMCISRSTILYVSLGACIFASHKISIIPRNRKNSDAARNPAAFIFIFYFLADQTRSGCAIMSLLRRASSQFLGHKIRSWTA